MKSIGFKNFRKFIEFPELTFGDITLLVGKNNAGKSTLIKAIQLFSNYLKNSTSGDFSFVDPNITGSNIITFDRALCSHQNDSFIEFKASFPEFNCIVTITGDKDRQMINGQVTKATISGNLFSLHIDYLAQCIQVATKFEGCNESADDIEKIVETISCLKRDLKTMDPLDIAYINLNAQIKNFSTQLRNLRKNIKENALDGFDITIDQTDNWHTFDLDFKFDLSKSTWQECILFFINSVKNQSEYFKKSKARIKDKRKKISEMESVLILEKDLITFSEIFTLTSRQEVCYYLKSESRKQSAVLSTRDSENALASAVHAYFQAGILEGELEHRKVLEWMKMFNVGVNFQILPFGGEAYLCHIQEHEDDSYVLLADKGMGSIQIMTLIFKLATIIRERKFIGSTLIVEEPELNLHPALQSKLTDMFFEINKEFHTRFIIETHSEYLIRRSQVLVAQNNYKNEQDLLSGNNFAVYYFPSDAIPYEMKYRTDGKFSNEFGTGFFDEANKLIFGIL